MQMLQSKAAQMPTDAPSFTRQCAALIKFRLSLFIALSALLGFILHASSFSAFALLSCTGVFCLAGGSAVINNIQDRHLDRHGARTRHRPLAAGTFSLALARTLSLALLVAGGMILFIASNSTLPVMAGFMAVFFYNGLYTPLKQKTMFAIVPGTLCGMLPPLIGWLSAGGRQLTPDIIFIMVILGVWQLPHFWLVLLLHEKDYRNAQIPNLASNFSNSQSQRILFSWICAFAVLTLFLPLFSIVVSPAWRYLLAANATAIFLWSLCLLVRPRLRQSLLPTIILHFNGSLLLVLISGIAGRLS